jgi:hypothetical protein
MLNKTNKNIDEMGENLKRLKTVLNLPYLTHKYHKLTREDGLDEFQSLELVYAEFCLSEEKRS